MAIKFCLSRRDSGYPWLKSGSAVKNAAILATLGGIALGALAVPATQGQDIKLNVTYVCKGERLYVESCNIRDLSDTATCQVAHPDRPQHNGFMAYTTETRGSLKKLLPTCTQPTAAEIAKEEAFNKKQQEIYAAEVAKANPQPASPGPGTGWQAGPGSQAAQNDQMPAPPKDPQERAMRRCVSSGRLPATCTGNSLLGMFSGMISQVLPGIDKQAAPGPVMAGVFAGAGNWRLDFVDGGVLVNCAFLSPNQESYRLDFGSGRAALIISTTPKPLVLALKADGTLAGPPGPVVINGVVAAGYHEGMAPGAVYKDAEGNQYDAAQNKISGPVPGYTTFAPRQATCVAPVLSSKDTGPGIQTMQTDLLKTMFGGDKGPPTPPGIRMQGIFAAATGFSVEFFPESVILGCGPDAARAYPYTVTANGGGAVVKIDAPDHPLTLVFRRDGSLDPGATGPYQVHGRIVVGQDDNGDFTFAPMEQTCNLAVLAPAKQIPMTGGTASAPMMASAGRPGPDTAAGNGGGGISTPGAPLGNAMLSIVSGFPALPGVANPLAGRPYVLLRMSYADTIAQAGITVPQGMTVYKFVGMACGTRTPDCQKSMDAIKASAISAVRADTSGNGTLPGVPAGTYYLMISALYNGKSLVWGQAVNLKPGANSITLGVSNATPLN